MNSVDILFDDFNMDNLIKTCVYLWH